MTLPIRIDPPHVGWSSALRWMREMVESRRPFCHPRFADGEFRSILGRRGRNSDRHGFFSSTLGVDLRKCLEAIADRHPDHSGMVVGGWWDDKMLRWLVENDLLLRVPWVSSGCFPIGVSSLETLYFLKAVQKRAPETALVGPERLRPAAVAIGAQHVVVPLENAWLERERIEAEVRQLPRGTVVLYCCGMLATVLSTRLWLESPGTTHIDFGHVFDAILGFHTRRWMRNRRGPMRAIARHYRPWLAEPRTVAPG